jgi:hypothetical protein
MNKKQPRARTKIASSIKYRGFFIGILRGLSAAERTSHLSRGSCAEGQETPANGHQLGIKGPPPQEQEAGAVGT